MEVLKKKGTAKEIKELSNMILESLVDYQKLENWRKWEHNHSFKPNGELKHLECVKKDLSSINTGEYEIKIIIEKK